MVQRPLYYSSYSLTNSRLLQQERGATGFVLNLKREEGSTYIEPLARFGWDRDTHSKLKVESQLQRK
jgi:hypothetical protein